MTIRFTQQSVTDNHRIAYKVVRQTEEANVFKSQWEPNQRAIQKNKFGLLILPADEVIYKGEVVKYKFGELMITKEPSLGFYLYGELGGARREYSLAGGQLHGYAILKILVPRGTLIWEGKHTGFTDDSVFTAYEIVVLSKEQ